jgi:hypothetical protein
MADNNQTATSSKLKNPTRYHLLATQQRQQQGLNHLHDSIDPLALLEDQHLDFTDCYPNQPYSPLQEDDDTIDSPDIQRRISDIQQRLFQNSSNMFDFAEGSPSDYSSSVDMFPKSQPSPYFMHHRHNSISSLQDTPPSIYGRLSSSFDQPLSAPAGYDFLGIAFQPPTFSQSLAATGSRSLEEYESIQIK